MKIDVRVRGLPADAVLSGAIASLAQAHLGAFGADVFSVHVRLTDVKGPDVSASVTLYGPRIGAVTIDGHHQRPTVAVAAALERMEQVVRRDLRRMRSDDHDVVMRATVMAR